MDNIDADRVRRKARHACRGLLAPSRRLQSAIRNSNMGGTASKANKITPWKKTMTGSCALRHASSGMYMLKVLQFFTTGRRWVEPAHADAGDARVGAAQGDAVGGGGRVGHERRRKTNEPPH